MPALFQTGDFLGHYADDARAKLEQIRATDCSASGREEAGRLAHSLKATSFLLGFQAVGESARRLEMAAPDSDAETMDALIGELERSLAPVLGRDGSNRS